MRRMEAVIVDDLDGKSPAETVELVINGEKYSVDLSKKHRADLNRVLKRYLDAATQTAKPAAVRLPANPDERKTKVQEIREWANKRGLTVPSRGRLPKSIVDQYEQYNSNLTVVG